jgi:PAP2 superfamily
VAEKPFGSEVESGWLKGSGVSVEVQTATTRVVRVPDPLRRNREPPQQPPNATEIRQRRLTLFRRAAVATWVIVIVYRTLTAGVAFNRELVLVYVATGLVAASIGRRKMLMVVRDWLPFAVVLLVYDVSRGAAKLVGTPTLWQWQADVDRWLFFGNMPTVWLQERLKLAAPPWWEVAVSTVYMSFFVLPYVVAGVLWLRNREDWKAFVRRFVALSFTALAIYIVLPAAPPWAAARCTSDDIAGGPSYPTCMFGSPEGVPDGGLLGSMQVAQPGANEFVERISTRGWETLHLHVARDLVNSGQVSVNMVAAIPSLHAALAAMVAAFLWPRVQRRWRPLLATYVLMMAFTLVYSAEHYVIDILLGWSLAAVLLAVVGRFESRRSAAAAEPPPYDRRHGAAADSRAIS